MRARAAVLALLAGTALAVPASPASAAACPSSSAVTVVVDFASLGGGQQTRCTGVDPPSGLAALRDAGFTPTRAAQQPGYFVCRIDGKPASDPCQRTSPANAYWSYWHARRGGAWTYSEVGPADRDPAAGTVEGWAFGAGKPPASPPPAAAAPTPTPTRVRTAASPTPVSPSPASVPRVAATPPRSSSPRTAASAALPVVTAMSASPDPTARPTQTPAAAPPVPVATHGSTAGVVVTGLLVAALVAAGAAAAVRRRRES